MNPTRPRMQNLNNTNIYPPYNPRFDSTFNSHMADTTTSLTAPSNMNGNPLQQVINPNLNIQAMNPSCSTATSITTPLIAPSNMNGNPLQQVINSNSNIQEMDPRQHIQIFDSS